MNNYSLDLAGSVRGFLSIKKNKKEQSDNLLHKSLKTLPG